MVMLGVLGAVDIEWNPLLAESTKHLGEVDIQVYAGCRLQVCINLDIVPVGWVW